eukprot:gene9543-3720_t
MTGLRDLDLQDSGLQGTLPPQWSAMTRMGQIVLSTNDLTSSVPVDTLKTTDPLEWKDNEAMGALNIVYLTDNTKLCGIFPAFPLEISVYYNNTEVNKSYNTKLCGIIPAFPVEMSVYYNNTGVNKSYNTKLCGSYPTFPVEVSVYYNNTRVNEPCAPPPAPPSGPPPPSPPLVPGTRVPIELFKATVARYIKDGSELPAVEGVNIVVTSRRMPTRFRVPTSSMVSTCVKIFVTSRRMSTRFRVPTSSKVSTCGKSSIEEQIYIISANMGLPTPNISADCSTGDAMDDQNLGAESVNVQRRKLTPRKILSSRRLTQVPACVVASTYDLDFTLGEDTDTEGFKSALSNYIKSIQVPECNYDGPVFYEETEVRAQYIPSSSGVVPVSCPDWTADAINAVNASVYLDDCMVPPPLPPMPPMTPEPPATTEALAESSDAVPVGLIAGAAAGAGLFFLLLLLCCCWWFACCCFRRRKKKEDEEEEKHRAKMIQSDDNINSTNNLGIEDDPATFQFNPVHHDDVVLDKVQPQTGAWLLATGGIPLAASTPRFSETNRPFSSGSNQPSFIGSSNSSGPSMRANSRKGGIDRHSHPLCSDSFSRPRFEAAHKSSRSGSAFSNPQLSLNVQEKGEEIEDVLPRGRSTSFDAPRALSQSFFKRMITPEQYNLTGSSIQPQSSAPNIMTSGLVSFFKRMITPEQYDLTGSSIQPQSSAPNIMTSGLVVAGGERGSSDAKNRSGLKSTTEAWATPERKSRKSRTPTSRWGGEVPDPPSRKLGSNSNRKSTKGKEERASSKMRVGPSMMRVGPSKIASSPQLQLRMSSSQESAWATPRTPISGIPPKVSARPPMGRASAGDLLATRSLSHNQNVLGGVAEDHLDDKYLEEIRKSATSRGGRGHGDRIIAASSFSGKTDRLSRFAKWPPGR